MSWNYKLSEEGRWNGRKEGGEGGNQKTPLT